MRKIFSLLTVFIFTFIFAIGFSSPASAAVKSSSYKQTLKYGNYVEPNSFDGARPMPGYAPMTVFTNFTVNQYGVSITNVSQRANYVWPYSIIKDGTKALIKSSRGSNETARAYGDFSVFYTVKWGLTEKDYRLQTNIKVLKIDKKKKTVTVQITNTVS